MVAVQGAHMEVIMWLLQTENKHNSQGGPTLASKNRPPVKVTYDSCLQQKKSEHLPSQCRKAGSVIKHKVDCVLGK